MADSQTSSGTDVYNAAYNQTSDSQIMMTGYDEQLQSRKQSQNFSHEPKNDIQPINSDEQLANNREQPPDYEQHPQNNEQHPQVYPNVEYDQQQPFIKQYTIVEQPLQTTTTVDATRRRYDQTLFACLVCLCCFWSTGIIALILSTKTNKAYKAGNNEKGHRYHTITFIFIAISVILGIAGIVLFVTTRSYSIFFKHTQKYV